MINPEEIKRYPICDCDVWLRLSWGDVLDKLFEIHDKIVIADFVEEEILRWEESQKFSKPAKDLKKYKDEGKVIIIKHDVHIPKEDRGILELRFRELGYYYGFTNSTKERKNKGEIASAIYAEYFNIVLMRSNDKEFIDKVKPRHFQELKVKDLNATLRDLRFKKEKERIQVMKRINEIDKQIRRENQRREENNAIRETIHSSKEEVAVGYEKYKEDNNEFGATIGELIGDLLDELKNNS